MDSSIPITSSIHVVALNGSPHRQGNTATLMAWVLEGCQSAGATVEWVHVVDYHVEYCQGCFTCMRTGDCPIQDDLTQVRGKLLAADGLVVGAPVYSGHPPAQMRTLMDRLTLLNLYTGTFERQRTLGVATSGVAPVGGVAKDLAVFFGRCHATIGAKTASIKHGYRPLKEHHDPRLPPRARVSGRRLVQEIRSPRRRWLPAFKEAWIALLRRFVVRPLVLGQRDQFAGVLRIWQEKGWIPTAGEEPLRKGSTDAHP